MTLELFNYTLIGIRSLYEPANEAYDNLTYFVGGDKTKARSLLMSIYDPNLFKGHWVVERSKSNIILINEAEMRAIIPVSFSDHPHFKARSYGKERQKALVKELYSALKRAYQEKDNLQKVNPEYKVSVLCLDKSLGFVYDEEHGGLLDGYYLLNDIDVITEVKKFKFEYLILYSPIKHMPTPGYDEIGEYEAMPRLSIMDQKFEGSSNTRSYRYASFKEVNLCKEAVL